MASTSKFNNSEMTCGFCHRGREVERLCGTLLCETFEDELIVAHHKCMQYSALLSQYKMKEFGGFEAEEVKDEIARGLGQYCYICRNKKKGSKKVTVTKPKSGATSGCAISKCRKTFHFYCARRAEDQATMCAGTWKFPQPRTAKLKINVCKEKTDFYRVYCSEKHELEDRKILEKRHGKNSIIKISRGGTYDSSDEEDSEDVIFLSETSMPELVNRRKLSSRVTDQAHQGGTTSESGKTDTDDGSSVYTGFSDDTSADNTNDALHNIEIDTDEPSAALSDNQNKPGPSFSNADASHSMFVISEVYGSGETPVKSGAYAIAVPMELNISSDLRQKICQKVNETMGIPGQRVLILQDLLRKIGVRKDHLPHIALEISEKLKEGDMDFIYKTLMASEQGKINTVLEFLQKLPEELKTAIEQAMFDLIKENLNEAEEKMKHRVGEFLRVDGCIVVLLQVDDVTDTGSTIRTKLISGKVYEWNSESAMLDTHQPDQVSIEQEFSTLYQWLREELERYGGTCGLHIMPCEGDLVFCGNRNFQVAENLKSQLEHAHERKVKSVLVLCISNVDTGIVKYKQYVHKTVRSYIEHTPHNTELYCVFGVSRQEGFQSLKDMLPEALSNEIQQKVAVFSAFSPEQAPVSCVVLQYKNGDMENDAYGSLPVPTEIPEGSVLVKTEHMAATVQTETDIKQESEIRIQTLDRLIIPNSARRVSEDQFEELTPVVDEDDTTGSSSYNLDGDVVICDELPFVRKGYGSSMQCSEGFGDSQAAGSFSPPNVGYAYPSSRSPTYLSPSQPVSTKRKAADGETVDRSGISRNKTPRI